eukprot:2432686-Amphidinium_carterae.1
MPECVPVSPENKERTMHTITQRRKIQDQCSSNDEYKESFDSEEDPRCVRLTCRPPGATRVKNEYESW